MIEAKDINFAYRRGVPVLKDIECTIKDGEFVALLGHNGSGKTTLSRLFMALDHPRSGQILIDGQDIVNLEPADLADKIGYVFQNPDLQILADTVFDEVAYGPRAKKLTEANVKTQVEAALAAMGLSSLAGGYPRVLSFGQKRRLGVAAALALNPRTLILDEITNGQDAAEQTRMMEYLKAINEERGVTIILITHDMGIVRRYAKRTLVLTDGELVFDGTPQDLFEGGEHLEAWGLRRPVVSVLGANFGISAATVDELCAHLVKGDECDEDD
jgi:energy-coupling factor transport system ATP-binding protein